MGVKERIELDELLTRLSSTDSEKAIDGDWGARFRVEVLVPFTKLLGDYVLMKDPSQLKPFMDSVLESLAYMLSMSTSINCGDNKHLAEISADLLGKVVIIKAQGYSKLPRKPKP